jgi:hypothetical protein
MPHYQMNSSEQLCAVPVTPVSSTNKTARHDIAEILLKVALNTISLDKEEGNGRQNVGVNTTSSKRLSLV